jgi:hypothetical protein
VTVQRASQIDFSLRHRADRVYVALRADGAVGGTVIPMSCDGETDEWRATVALWPGTYRFRYYVDDGRCITYFSPADAGGDQRVDFMDAILTVGGTDARAAVGGGSIGIAPLKGPGHGERWEHGAAAAAAAAGPPAARVGGRARGAAAGVSPA